MAGPFNKDRLKKGRTKSTSATEIEAHLWSEGHILEIEHVPTTYKVKFPAYLQNFSDAYTQSWNAEDAYGRMDPIAVFQNTRRAIAMSWHVPASDFDQAKENLDVINLLMSFMYPVYSAGKQGGDKPENCINQGAVLNMGPLVRVKFGNLISNAQDPTKGLMGYVNGFTVDINTDEGIFHDYPDNHFKDAKTGAQLERGGGGDSRSYYPKSITLNFELNVLHEHPMGWVKKDNDYVWTGGIKGFPYRTDNPVPSFSNPSALAAENPAPRTVTNQKKKPQERAKSKRALSKS